MIGLVLYTNPMSRGRISRWMLDAVGAPHRVETLDYAGSMKTAAFLAFNPMTRPARDDLRVRSGRRAPLQ